MQGLGLACGVRRSSACGTAVSFSVSCVLPVGRKVSDQMLDQGAIQISYHYPSTKLDASPGSLVVDQEVQTPRDLVLFSGILFS